MIDEAIITQAIEDLTHGMLMKDVVAKHGISNVTVYNHMKRRGIQYGSDHGRKNHVDKSFFNSIDNEDKAYWLGFIYADGCVTHINTYDTKPGRLSINISAKDKDHLAKFNQAIQSTYKIREYIPHESTYSNHPMCRLDIASVELCSSLIRHGVIPAKTDKILFPYQSMSEDLYRHFIRGFFDGDGSLGDSNFTIIGYKPFLLAMQEVLVKNCDLNYTKLVAYPHKAVDIYNLRYGGRLQLQRIYHYLYDNASIFLERKHSKFQLVISN